MKVLYLTTFVLGDAGANAADIFPRLAVEDPTIERVYVADFPKNKHHIQARQGAEFLKLEWGFTWFRYAARIARKCKQDEIDIIHVFYRQQNAVILILIRLWLIALNANATIIMDHRSINLARGWRRWQKKALNFVMQISTHRLAGNLLAVETNHVAVFKPRYLIDLGYDELPDPKPCMEYEHQENINVWFIGSLKPRNRKSQLLIDVFSHVAAHQMKHMSSPKIIFHVAGPTRPDQQALLEQNPQVRYHGVLQRQKLYKLLGQFQGVGLAYMNHEFHEFAPSLKFAEYAIMRFPILSSDTIGLKTQAARMSLPRPVKFVSEDVEAWSKEILTAAQNYEGPEPFWEDSYAWSYPDIFRRQVLSLYRQINGNRTDSILEIPRKDATENQVPKV